MTQKQRHIIPILTLFILLLTSACQAPQVSGKTNNDHKGGAKAQLASTPVPPALGPNAKTTTCPSTIKGIPTCLTPYELRQAYGVEGLYEKGWTGKGQAVIDVVSFGSPTLKQDMDVYDQAFGLPPIDLQIISPLNVPEYDPRHDKAGWAGETTLDVQVIHAIAPDAKVIVLTSPVAEIEGTTGLPEFLQLEQYAVDHKLGYIFSQSWGASELTLADQKGQQELQKWNDFYQKATTQQGVTVFNSSGDEGATDYADMRGAKLATGPTTSFAGDSPWVTGVGGTTLTRNGDNSFTERAWTSSGGGFSRFYQTPDYQKTLPASVQNQLKNRRGVPDVSANADPGTGLAIYQVGVWNLGGGTSASAPVWAGVMAIADQMAGHPLGFINPTLYKLAQSSTYTQDFRDITEGNNTYGPTNVSGYSAKPGWDPVTGLGTPLAEKLLPDMIAAMK